MRRRQSDEDTRLHRSFLQYLSHHPMGHFHPCQTAQLLSCLPCCEAFDIHRCATSMDPGTRQKMTEVRVQQHKHAWIPVPVSWIRVAQGQNTLRLGSHR